MSELKLNNSSYTLLFRYLDVWRSFVYYYVFGGVRL